MERPIKRCPKCKSSRIYRRIRRDGLSRLNKGRKVHLGKIYILTKQYICRKCNHEFNNPSIGINSQN